LAVFDRTFAKPKSEIRFPCADGGSFGVGFGEPSLELEPDAGRPPDVTRGACNTSKFCEVRGPLYSCETGRLVVVVSFLAS
jgi:hypothetical protein